MSKRLPPLNALKAFEAAARHGNLARASQELHVTAGALSHQIRALEDQLGAELFSRHARGVTLTASGRLLYPGLLAGFGLIREAVEQLHAASGSPVVVVSAPPGLTSKWLAPRLHRFAQAHPEVDLRISSSGSFASFGPDGVDVAIRSITAEQAADPALVHEKLVESTMVAVCSPSLMGRGSAAMILRALAQMPLIHDEQAARRVGGPGWAEWFRAAGLDVPDLRRGLRFNSADHAIEAALQGGGLALTHSMVAADDLRNGRLVMPLPIVLPSGRAYYLVRPAGQPLRRAVAQFGEWLHAEIAKTSLPALEDVTAP